MSGLAPRSLDFLPGYRRPSTGDELPTTSAAKMLMRVKHSKSEPAVGSKRYVLLGICAMEKKAKSKYMHEILSRLQEFECIKLVIFDQATVFNEKIEKWPIVDALIAFYSKGFPLEKAVKYAKLRNPYLINDIEAQYDLLDRRKVYAKLKRVGIPHPRYAVLDRDDPAQLAQFVENDDNIEFNGHIFYKPFVEKPVSAEDHNIYIYYPPSAGGGSQRLFRKIGCRSSVYSRESNVRNRSSYIYEEFLATDGTDVKVYTVGPEYAHAEARKSPALDGIVERDSHGKEVRYPVILSNHEKLIARKVVLAFRQIVCGFDLLRTNGTSYVCDVNGFSFVKNSMIYYDDCSKILANQIMSYLSPLLHIPWNPPFTLDEQPLANTTSGKLMELRAVIGVIRHSDRTPKQKMKMEVYHPKFYDIYRQNGGTPTVSEPRDVKLKTPKQLQLVLDVVRSILEGSSADDAFELCDKNRRAKLEQLRSVLEMYGYFSGINRKIQLRYQPRRAEKKSSGTDEEPTAGSSAPTTTDSLGNSTNNTKSNNNNSLHESESNNSLRAARNSEASSSLLLIAKWGGELTPLGRYQAESLGKVFRCMYPGGPSYKKRRGLGFLRLHSTFRNDLKIYASDEGRVQTTAAAFSKGLLALEGELTPIMVQMVKTENSLLDNDVDARGCQMAVKCRIHEILHQNREFNADDHKALNPLNVASVRTAMNAVRNPLQACQRLHEYIQRLCLVMRRSADEISEFSSTFYSSGESRDLLMRRWSKLEKDFKHKDGTFDISKIPDIYDCIKFDSLHRALKVPFAQDFFLVAKGLADIVIPLEYGITRDEKTTIAQGICSPLLRKIRADIYRVINSDTSDDLVHRLNPRFSKNVSSPKRLVRTRLYFTSESHLHSLVNILRFGGLFDELVDEQWRRSLEYLGGVSELNFLTQIVFMLYEDPTYPIDSEQRFLMEIHFSPGMMPMYEIEEPEGPGFRTIYREGSPSDESALLQQAGQKSPAKQSPASSGVVDAAVPEVQHRTNADLLTLSSSASATDRRHSAAVDGSDSSGGSGTPSTPVAPVGDNNKSQKTMLRSGSAVPPTRAADASNSGSTALSSTTSTQADVPPPAANIGANVTVTSQQHYISPDEPIISVSRFKVRRLGRPPPPPSSESSNGSTKSPGSPGSSNDGPDLLTPAIPVGSYAAAETLKRLNSKTGGGVRQQSDPVDVPNSPSAGISSKADDDMNNNNSNAASMSTINVPSSRFDRFAQKKRIGSIALRIVPTTAQPAASRKVDMSALFSTSVIRGGGAGTRATSIQQLARGESINGTKGGGMASTFRDADSDPSGLAGAGLIARTPSGGSAGAGSIGSGSGVTVPNIYGLETLHNGLSLKRFEAFLSRVTIGYLSSRSLSPSSTPMYKHVTQSDILKMLQFSNNKLAMQSLQQTLTTTTGSAADDPALMAAAKRANAIALAVSDMLLTPDNNTSNANALQQLMKPSGCSMHAVASLGLMLGGGHPSIKREDSQANASRINEINVVNPNLRSVVAAALQAGGSTADVDDASEELARLSSSTTGDDDLSSKSKQKRVGSKKVRIKDITDGDIAVVKNTETEIIPNPEMPTNVADATSDALPSSATEKSSAGSSSDSSNSTKPSNSIGVMRRFNGNPPCAVDNFRSLIHMPSSSPQCRSTDALSSLSTASSPSPLPFSNNNNAQLQHRSTSNMRKPSRENSVMAVNVGVVGTEDLVQQRRLSGDTVDEATEGQNSAVVDEHENINNVNTTGTTLVIEPSATIPGTERRGSFQRRQCVDNDEKDHEERDRRLLDTLSDEERHAVLYMRTTTVDESHYD